MQKANIYEGIMRGLQEAVEFKKGDLSKGRVRIHTKIDPVHVASYKPADVLKVRRTLNLSQRGFAAAIGVSTRTVEAWENGRSVPSGVATRMLHLIETDNSLIDKLIIRNNG